ncbi:MAG: hypothetical protein A3K19_30455 [Lentisphaerae bacterium RIFOXYB12_FULL_65_16]|nr:MAG: hypothetical protein A3K19_30455 [Lentisphaerae bacterium RIFOXYB12_FULL_65_16]
MQTNDTAVLTLISVSVSVDLGGGQGAGAQNNDFLKAFLDHWGSRLSLLLGEQGAQLVAAKGNLLQMSVPDADMAVTAACAAQDATVPRLAGASNVVMPELRVVLHGGEVLAVDGYGAAEALDAARRITELARPRQILVVADVYQRLSDKGKARLRHVRKDETGATGFGGGDLYEVPWQELTASTPEEDAASADNTQIVPMGKRPIRVLPPEEQDEPPPATDKPAPPQVAAPKPPPPAPPKATPPAPPKAAAPAPPPPPPPPPPPAPPKAVAPAAAPPKKDKLSPFAPRRPSAPKAVPVRRAPVEEPEPVEPPQGRRLRVTFAGNVVLIDRIAPMASIGRSSANELMADAPSVSRMHAKLIYRDDCFYVVDFSKNGTYIYDERGTEMLVHKYEFKLPFSGRLSLGRPKDDGQAKIMLFRTEAGPVSSG